MTASGDLLSHVLGEKGIDVDQVSIDPALPKLKLPKGVFSKWIKTFTDVDETCLKQVELLRSSPLIPEDVIIMITLYRFEIPHTADSLKLRLTSRLLQQIAGL